MAGALKALTFHEYYGEVSKEELRAIKKFNVSPSDHDELTTVIGAEHHEAITRCIIDLAAHSKVGFYNPTHWDICGWWMDHDEHGDPNPGSIWPEGTYL